MIIPEDGCLPKITRTGFAAFNNVMIIKVPEKYRKPGETLYQLATLDRSKKGERWPADKYIDGSNPELEPEVLEHDEVRKDTNTNEKTKVFKGEIKISPDPHISEVQVNKFDRNKSFTDSEQTFYERVPAYNKNIIQSETSPTISSNTLQTYSQPDFNAPLDNSTLSKEKYDGLLGERPPPESLFNHKFFGPSPPEHEYNRRLSNETNFQRGMNSNNKRKFPNCTPGSTFVGFSRNNYIDNFSHKRKYNNIHQNGPPAKDSYREKYGDSSKPAFGNAYFNNCPPSQDFPGNSFIEPHHVNPHNYPTGPPDPMNAPTNFPPMPSYHLVRPFNPSHYAEPPESSHIRPYRNLSPTDLTRMPERNLPNNNSFTGVANDTFGIESFPSCSYDGIQRNIPPYSENNFSRMNNLDPLTNNAIQTCYDQVQDNCPTTDYSRRNPHHYNNDLDFWNGQNKPKPPFRDREDVSQGNNYKYRNQQQPWRGNKSKNMYSNKGRNDFNRGRRRNNRYRNNNRNNMKNDNQRA